MEQLLSRILSYLVDGGPVMIPLVLIGTLVWYLLGLRAFILRRGFGGSLNEAIVAMSERRPPIGNGVVAAALRRAARSDGPSSAAGEIEVVVEVLRQQMQRFRRTINALVTSAPLLGLLGTVIGMIETFASLTDQRFHAQTGGVAGGISAALITTQMGLLVAIPSLFVARWLDRKERALTNELERVQHALHIADAATDRSVCRAGVPAR